MGVWSVQTYVPYSLGHRHSIRCCAAIPPLQVLSVRKALSIQSHPDKQLAEKLHAEHPHLYPDDNHKPEMALVLPGSGGGSDDGGGFEALCGFCPPEELREALRGVPELAECVGPEAAAPLLAPSGRQPGVEVGWVMDGRRGRTEVPTSMQPSIEVG